MHRLRPPIALFCMLVLFLTASGTAFAGLDADERASEFYRSMQTGEQQLRTTSAPSDQQILDYLNNAVSAVYWARVYAATRPYTSDIERVNDSLESVVPLGLIASWPLNPFNNWEPMRVLSTSDSFSPGDLVLQLCPPSENSERLGVNLPMSFALSIYGPNEEFASRGQARAMEGNTNANWTVVPSGALYMLSLHVPSARERAEVIAIKKAQKAQKAKQQQQNAQPSK